MLILLYNLYFNKRFSIYDQLQIGNLPELLPDNVHITNNKDLLEQADAVIFNLPHLPHQVKGKLEKRRNQIWIAWDLECDQNYPWIIEPRIKQTFDLWMTYHLDADVVLPYYDPTFLQKLHIPPHPKNKDICMFVSSPVNQSKRLEYLKELMTYISIDSFGRIFNNCKLSDDNGYASKLNLIKEYKFTIAFENAIRNDYVTEKFFDPLLSGPVPIYLGAPNIERFSPGEKSFINIKNYSSPKILAQILQHLYKKSRHFQSILYMEKQPLKQELQELIEEQSIHPFIRLINILKKQGVK